METSERIFIGNIKGPVGDTGPKGATGASGINGKDELYHPLIVTLGNSCKLATGGSTCYNCDNRFTSGLTSYCIARSKELDPCK